KKPVLEMYQKEVTRLAMLVKHQINIPLKVTGDETLLIIIGSQKGLCGTFNTNLIRFIEHNFDDITLKSWKIIGVGKQLIGLLPLKKNISFYKTYPLFNQSNFVTYAQIIT